MGKVNKKGRKDTLKTLRGALKGLLSKDPALGHRPEAHTVVPQTTQSEITTVDDEPETAKRRNGVVYIMSKERQLIPKLTEDEVMERHRMADENMKHVWAKIIDKYESIADQGDIVDLNTGEIIEDNGHLRSLSADHASSAGNPRYVSVLSDLLDVDNAEGDVWRYEYDEQDDLDEQGEQDEQDEENEQGKQEEGPMRESDDSKIKSKTVAGG